MLREGRLAGAAFDVFATEPPDDLELLNLPNFFATPHLGGSTEKAILARGRAAIAGQDQAKPVKDVIRKANIKSSARAYQDVEKFFILLDQPKL
jgi:phosphoglycerate dehydrogenase-like enzyme